MGAGVGVGAEWLHNSDNITNNKNDNNDNDNDDDTDNDNDNDDISVRRPSSHLDVKLHDDLLQ